MRKNNKAITAVLLGSIAVLVAVGSYAVINNKETRKKTAHAAQHTVPEVKNNTTEILEMMVSEEFVYEGSEEYSEHQPSASVSNVLAEDCDVDLETKAEDTVSFSQIIESNDDPETVIVTPETFGSDDSIYVACIGHDVTEIIDGSFSKLKNLKEIRVDSRNQYYTSFDGCLYTKDLSTLICVPQNTTEVSIISSIKGYTPHALDGLEQSRIDKLNSILDGSYCEKNEEDTATQDSNGMAAEENTEVTQPDQDDTVTPDTVADNNDTIQIIPENKPKGPSRSSSTDFSQYVCINGKGEKEFNYTGSGDENVIIPDGVETVGAFGVSIFDRNYDVKYVYIPGSVEKMKSGTLNNSEATNWDFTMYNLLYQLPNLQTIESDADSYRVDDHGLYRPANGNKIYVWSKYEMIPYDLNKYRELGVLR